MTSTTGAVPAPLALVLNILIRLYSYVHLLWGNRLIQLIISVNIASLFAAYSLIGNIPGQRFSVEY